MIDANKINSLFEDTSIFDGEGSRLIEYALHKVSTKFKPIGIMSGKVEQPYYFGGRPQLALNNRNYEFTYQFSRDQLKLTQAPTDKFLKKLLVNYIKQFSKFFKSSDVRFDLRRASSRNLLFCGEVSSDMMYVLKKLNLIDSKSLIHTRFCFFEIYFSCYEKDNDIILSCDFLLQDYHFMRSVDELISSDVNKIEILNLYIEELLKVSDLIVKAIRLIDIS